MKRSAYVFFLIIVSLFGLSLVGCGSDATSQSQTVALTEADSGMTIPLRQNQIITVSVHGNGSTGYTWEVLSGAESNLTQQGACEFVADSNATGSGGTYRYAFMATSQGTGNLQMVYHRPGETGVAPLQSFEITVVVSN